jgi:hypothetical protein
MRIRVKVCTLLYLDVLHELVGCVGVPIGEGGVDGQGDAGPHDGQQNEDLEPFCLCYLKQKMLVRIYEYKTPFKRQCHEIYTLKYF